MTVLKIILCSFLLSMEVLIIINAVQGIIYDRKREKRDKEYHELRMRDFNR